MNAKDYAYQGYTIPSHIDVASIIAKCFAYQGYPVASVILEFWQDDVHFIARASVE